MKKTFKKTEQEKRLALKKIAIQLYNEGLTTREIGKQLGRSHAWVALVVKEPEEEDKENQENLTSVLQ